MKSGEGGSIVRPTLRPTLRRRVLLYVGGLVILSLLGSTLSLVQISGVNRQLEEINRVSLPVSRLFAQMNVDADVFRRELNRSLGSIYWNDPHWKPRPVPKWISDVIDNEMDRTRAILGHSELGGIRWDRWVDELSEQYEKLKTQADQLYRALEGGRQSEEAAKLYPVWLETLDDWSKKLQWGMHEHERAVRESFSTAQNQVANLRTGLEVILLVVIGLSMMLLWIGERALRPLADLMTLAREITRRGLRREDKASLPAIYLNREDEVSQLAREFHRMATQLLEREKVVEDQKGSLERQNQLLREMGKLNETVLDSIRSALVVTSLDGKITALNPQAIRWLGVAGGEAPSREAFLGTNLFAWPKVRQVVGRDDVALSKLAKVGERFEPRTVDGKIYVTQVYPLMEEGQLQGAIWLIEDVSAEWALQDRLQKAENLASVGRLSAQVAHEVRNPLHSIGLEAEMALEELVSVGASGPGSSRAASNAKQSLQSILVAVDRLEKITENYLKLSKFSAGSRATLSLADLLSNVLASFASRFENQRVRVDWNFGDAQGIFVFVDAPMMEQAIGNLVQNALQALEGVPEPEIRIQLGRAESGRAWIRIRDNGPGIKTSVREKLFTPFVTTKAQGTGLGLSFVKKVLEDHHGDVRIVDAPAGACFEILLPEAETAGRSAYAETTV